MKYREISKCRISGSTKLIDVLDLGTMALTGVFPRDGEPVTSGPLSLVFCPDSQLLQLKQSYDLGEMYGDNYGYRSGLNAGMVKHLRETVAKLQRIKPVDAESAVLDIGGNDGTLLKAYDIAGLERVCVDPTLKKWMEYYADTGIYTVDDFFPSPHLTSKEDGPLKYDIITSIACFYDLEDPEAFVRGIKYHLNPDGIWHFEQSYLPSMLKAGAYDTICHEHLEFYSLGVIYRLLSKCGLRVIDVELNDINGGSIAVTAAHANSKFASNSSAIKDVWYDEPWTAAGWMKLLNEFAIRTQLHREDMQTLIRFLRDEGHKVAALGASTKGNVLLQWCGLTSKDIEFVSDVNPEKWSRCTPGTNIPIISEDWARKLKPDYMLVLPWHFRDGIIEREREYLEAGGKLVFPLPEIEIVGKEALK